MRGKHAVSRAFDELFTVKVVPSVKQGFIPQQCPCDGATGLGGHFPQVHVVASSGIVCEF